MLWFLGQSLLLVGLAYLLGGLTAWLWWRWQWRRIPADESAALTELRRRQDRVLTEKNLEIARLRAVVADSVRIQGQFPTATAVKDAGESPGNTPGAAIHDHDGNSTELPDGDPAATASPAAGEWSAAATGDDTGSRDPAAAETAQPHPDIQPVSRAHHPSLGELLGLEDDLEAIEGVGPRIAAALHEAGLRTYTAVAQADVTTLQAALTDAGLRFAPSLPTWARQAAYLAAEDLAGFQAFTEHLRRARDIRGG